MTNVEIRGRGRPRRTEPLYSMTLRLPHQLEERLKEAATADGQELAAWIRFACVNELRRRKK
jgi:hypothetical protein